MKADELIALAAAHGIDLVQAARMGENAPRRDVVQQRFESGRRAPVLQPPPKMLAHGKATPTYDRPEWSLAELGQAAKDVPQVAFWAACFAFAGDRSVYWKLWDALLAESIRLRRLKRWPAQVPGMDGRPRHYLAEIAQLVLDEDAHPHIFRAAPALYAVYVGVNDHIWSRHVFERFDQVKLRYLGWLATAQGIISPRLRSPEQAELDDVATVE